MKRLICLLVAATALSSCSSKLSRFEVIQKKPKMGKIEITRAETAA